MTTPGFQLETVDQNLKAISAIEGSWTMDALPDEVKLDLAMSPSMTPDTTASLLQGLEQDIAGAERRAPQFTRPEPAPVREYDSYSASQQIGRVIAAQTGAPAPQVLAEDSVQRWKQRAVDQGYIELTPREIMSPEWRPEYSSIASEMNMDQMQREFQGEKPGSFGMGTFVNLVEEWLSPRGLYQAAMELDLLPDFDAIAEETATWGDRLRGWAEDPFNPRKMLDALGPMDDIFFPVLNWGLMMSGVGEVWKFTQAVGKGAQAAGKAGKVANVAGLYRGKAGLRAMVKSGDVAADVARFKKESMFNTVLQGSGALPSGPVGAGLQSVRQTLPVRSLSKAGQAWRQRSSVAVAKKANQQVMRLGVVSNIEGLVDRERTGTSIANVTTLDEWHKRTFANPLADFAFDALFSPVNIFEPGSLIAGAKAAGSGVRAVTPGVNKIPEDSELTIAFDKGVRQWLAEDGDEALKRYDLDVRKTGSVKQAMANQITNGDVKMLDSAMAFISTMGALDSFTVTASRIAGVAEMSADELKLFHHIRNQTAATMVHVDEGDLEGALAILARYGDASIEDGPATGLVRQIDDASGVGVAPLRKKKKLAERRNRLRDAYLESHEEVAARGGKARDTDHRFYGYKDPDTGRITWTDDAFDETLGENPYYFDVDKEELAAYRGVNLGDELRDVTNDELEFFAGRYQGVKLDRAGTFRGWSRQGRETLGQLIATHNKGRKAFFEKMLTSHMNPEMLATYIGEVAPTFGRYGQFVESTDAIKQALHAGLLDGMEAVPAISPAGRRVSVHGTNNDWADQMYHLMIQVPGDQELAAHLNKSFFTPFAREMDPLLGGATVMNRSTRTKQQAVEAVSSIRTRIKKIKDYDRIYRDSSAVSAANELEELAESTLGAPPRELITDLASKYSLSAKQEAGLRRLHKYAQEKGISIAEVRKALEGELDELRQLPTWSEHFGVAQRLHMADDSVEAAEKLAKELEAKSKFMASEINPDSIPRELAETLAENDYKLGFGVEFFQPHQMMDLMPQFADANNGMLRNKKLQGFFGRQDPNQMRWAKSRVLRSSIYADMNQAKRNKLSIHRDLGAGPDVGAGDMDQIMRDIWDVLDQAGQDARAELERLRTGRATERFLGRGRLGRVPMTPEDLPLHLTYRGFMDRFEELGYTTDEAKSLFRALKKSRKIGWDYHGLYNVETHLRSNNNLAQGLSLLGRHNAADGIINKTVNKGIGWGLPVGGSFAAAHDYAESHPDEMGTTEGQLMQFGAAALGGLVGRAAGAGVTRHLDAIPGVGRLFDGSEIAVKNAAKLAKRENDAKWLKYGYLADNVAGWRDQLRFTLSPIFDASRYSEAIILSQLEEMPPGLRNLKLNQSPTSYRKALARDARKTKGMTADQARKFAEAEWEARLGEFASAAKGDFDWETIDSVGRRFSSVGILGFNPGDWMASTFAHLRNAGVADRKAYEMVREMYTYGTTHRSAAEMSMNFVFFPFSFSKKVAGHLTRNFNSDLSRLVMIHDGLAAYQLLDEKYDLGQALKDRLPIIEKAYRLNVLAYGASLGRFGGVNAQIGSMVRDMPLVGNAVGGAIPEMDTIMNLFIPQAIPVNNAQQAEELWDHAQKLIPVWGDVQAMVGAAFEQGEVLASDSHLTTQAQNTAAYEEWRTFQESLKPTLEAAGISWGQAMRDPNLSHLINVQKLQISAKYPNWKYELGDGIAHNAANSMEIQERVMNPTTAADRSLVVFEEVLESVKLKMASENLSISNHEDVPPEVFEIMQRVARELGEKDPTFINLYNRFYRRMFGPILLEMI